MDSFLTTKTSIFSANALTVLCTKKYFLYKEGNETCERCGDTHETEEQFIERISMGNPEFRTKLIEPLRFLPNSPTLFNMDSGFNNTLSACFKFDVEDTMFDSPDGIMPVMMKAAKVLKAGGGVGYSFHLRPAGSEVHSTHGKALGTEGVMNIYHEMAKQITQGGKRDAAQMGIIHCDDPDLERFIHMKDIGGDYLSTFNISVALTDQFMLDATTDIDESSERFLERTYARRILKEMAESAWRTGDPGVFFIDEAERWNPTPWAGKLTGTNPCGEVPLLRNEPCNLGSINLAAHLGVFADRVQIDWPLLRQTARLATAYLDQVLDKNVFPDPEIDAAARYTRKLGLGVMGFADVLAVLKIQYDTQEAVDLGHDIEKVIDEEAAKASLQLAAMKGPAPCFTDTSYKGPMYRNATRTCIAPTGTIAIIAGVSSGIEPYFARKNTRRMSDGTILIEKPWTLINGDFEPKVANEIAPYWHVAHQAAFQQNTNLAVSKTINMANDVTPDDILEAYISMWKTKCKGGTVYRDGSREVQVLNATILTTDKEWEVTIPAVVSKNGWRDALPANVKSIRHKFEIGGVEGYAHVGLYEDGSPAELFLDVARQNSTLDGFADWLAQGASVAWQIAHKYDVSFTVFTDKWIGRKFEPSGMTKNPAIPFADSIADYLGRWLNMEFANREPLSASPVQVQTDVKLTFYGDACPDCGSMLVHSEGCSHCNSCGYEKC